MKLGSSAAEADFEGALSADSNRMTGVLSFEDRKFDVVFERSGKPEFSGSFLELEGAADDSSQVEKLSPTGAELQRRFNADRNKVRLLMLLAPT